MPIEQQEAQEYYGKGGQYTTIRKLCKPGESVTAKLIDLNKDHKSKFPMKDKDYSYVISMEMDGTAMRMSVNSKSLLQQVIAALYPDGPSGKLQPCLAKISRRVERKTYESEAVITKITESNDPTDEIQL